MNKEIYINMAEGLSSQLVDLLSGATYDQKDIFIDCLAALMMDTSSDRAVEELSRVIFDIYSRRIDEEAVDDCNIDLSQLSFKTPAPRGDDCIETGEFEIGEDDFLFSL